MSYIDIFGITNEENEKILNGEQLILIIDDLTGNYIRGNLHNTLIYSSNEGSNYLKSSFDTKFALNKSDNWYYCYTLYSFYCFKYKQKIKYISYDEFHSKFRLITLNTIIEEIKRDKLRANHKKQIYINGLHIE